MTFVLTDRQREVQTFLEGPERHKLVYGGARSGKTLLIVRAIFIRALKASVSRHAILRFRMNAARASIAQDTLPKVASICFPGLVVKEYRQDGFFELPNKSQIWIGGLDEAERVEKILGQEFATIYFNECSQIGYREVLVARTRLAQVCRVDLTGDILRQQAYYDLNPVGSGHWSNIQFGEHKDPGVSPAKPLADPGNYARTWINPVDNRANLSPEMLAELEDLPERQRKRFYEGIYVPEMDGALWSFEQLEGCRLTADEKLPDFSRVVIAVDPSGCRGEEDVRSDEIGIIVAAKGVDGRAYVLADKSCRLSPAGWGWQVVTAYREFKADCVVAEVNYGGPMVESTIRISDPSVRYKEVTASRGKIIRAEPVSGLYEKGKVSHVGRFAHLEDQMTKFSLSGYLGDRSPDRADALVWALTELMLGGPSEMLITDEMLRMASQRWVA